MSADLPNTIPHITDPLGRGWTQPDISQVLIDDTHAVMSEYTFDRLPEYSATLPSGVYPGKCWKAAFDTYDCKKGAWLRWFGNDKDPKFVTNNQRIILILTN